jgi:hypothetical protein
VQGQLDPAAGAAAQWTDGSRDDQDPLWTACVLRRRSFLQSYPPSHKEHRTRAAGATGPATYQSGDSLASSMPRNVAGMKSGSAPAVDQSCRRWREPSVWPERRWRLDLEAQQTDSVVGPAPPTTSPNIHVSVFNRRLR